MADANRVLLRYDQETAWGTADSSPKYKNLRFTSESLKGNKSTTKSMEIRSTRDISNILPIGSGAGGSVNIEWSCETYSDWILSALMASAWTPAVAVLTAGTASVNASAHKFTHASAWSANPTVGSIIEVRGMEASGNNGYFKVTAVSNTEITVENYAGLSDVSGDTGVTIVGCILAANGTTETSYSIEREHPDLTTTFSLFTGMEITGMSMDVPLNGPITGAFDFIGEIEEVKTATSGDGSPTAATTTPVLSSVTNAKYVYLDGAAIELMGASVKFSNALREIRKVGSANVQQIGIGSFNIEGTAELLFTSNAQKTLFLNHTTCSLMFVFEDDLGNGLVIDLPSCKITDEGSTTPGLDGDVVERISFQAFLDTTENITARISRITA